MELTIISAQQIAATRGAFFRRVSFCKRISAAILIEKRMSETMKTITSTISIYPVKSGRRKIETIIRAPRIVTTIVLRFAGFGPVTATTNPRKNINSPVMV